MKIITVAGAAAASGCGPTTPDLQHLVPFIYPPENIVPGTSTWFATTCRECPAGCGMLGKNRDARLIKAEGNPAHPLNQGTLCPRGQASLQGHYNPDRFRGPLKRKDGDFFPVSWEEGEKTLVERLDGIVKSRPGGRIVFITGLMTGTLKQLISHWLAELGGGEHVLYEPFRYESLRTANRLVFGREEIPTYRIDRADFLVSFGAGFLETWVSNVEFARGFASFRASGQKKKNPFVFVGPRRSLTAANADLWIPVAPGDEYLIALGMLRVILDEGQTAPLNENIRSALENAVRPFPLRTITENTGVEEELIRRIGLKFLRSERPLALAEGLPFSSPHATETAVAADLLCALKPGSGETIDFSQTYSLGEAARATEIKDLTDRMLRGEIDMVLLYDANPLFTLPASWEFGKALEAVPLVVSFSSWMDETSRFAHLILPCHTPLESWGDYSPKKGVTGFIQPVMGNLHLTRHLGDILLSIGSKAIGSGKFPAKGFYGVLQETWRQKWSEAGVDLPFEAFWTRMVQRGGLWENLENESPPLSLNSDFQFEFPQPEEKEGLHLVAYPTIQFYDGRMANRPWIQELPDPLTQTTWGGWVEIHPETASERGISKGDVLEVATDFGVQEIPALPIFTVHRDVLAVPIGQGHFRYGRYATGLPANPLTFFPADLDPLSGGLMGPPLEVLLKKKESQFPLANTDGSFYQHDRGLAQTVSFSDYNRAASKGEEPHLDLPLPQGWDLKEDMYKSHHHADYRWAMVVDLDRCIGCGACVVACYAENNVAVVGRKQVLLGREMSWIRVQRYFEPEGHEVRWLVMLCQHCDAAPCEAVCPIFAPHHSVEGLNNQIYNRCFGTRFCSQNDPYKVRRFNWFTFKRDWPLDMQLNPDVTVRQKGVMEKCSFCIQRIAEAKVKARNEGRKVKDGDFTTACAQTCPTGALIFGSLLDPESRVSKLIHDPRAYQVLKHLNTKPAVIYLKRITQDV